jgi:hypothetical protein
MSLKGKLSPMLIPVDGMESTVSDIQELLTHKYNAFYVFKNVYLICTMILTFGIPELTVHYYKNPSCPHSGPITFI